MVRAAKVAVAHADAEEKKAEAAEQQERKLKLKLSTEKALLYGPMILLGPILPAVLAVINVVIGSAVLHGNPIDKTALQFCGAPLDRFVSASIAASYLFLIVFAWAFIGFEVTATIKGRRRILMRPFSSLPVLAIAYMIPLLMSIVVWIYGSWTVSQVRHVLAKDALLPGPALLCYRTDLLVQYRCSAAACASDSALLKLINIVLCAGAFVSSYEPDRLTVHHEAGCRAANTTV
jgi:hypothetical protein